MESAAATYDYVAPASLSRENGGGRLSLAAPSGYGRRRQEGGNKLMEFSTAETELPDYKLRSSTMRKSQVRLLSFAHK